MTRAVCFANDFDGVIGDSSKKDGDAISDVEFAGIEEETPSFWYWNSVSVVQKDDVFFSKLHIPMTT